MTQIALEALPSPIREKVSRLVSGEDLVITSAEVPFIRLSVLETAPETHGKRIFGSGRGQVLYMADDFDAPLEDFKDYM
jgi:hypothetical protein